MLAELGLTGEPRLMLVAAPDGVMAEASSLRPRPSFASGLMTAEPTPRIVWWAEPDELTPGALQRMGWMVSAAAGEAWLVLEGPHPGPLLPEGEGAGSVADVRAEVAAAGLRQVETRALVGGDVALRFVAGTT